MKEIQTFTILFWVCKNRLKNGKAPISARITVNGLRVEISTHRTVSPLEWDSKSQICTSRNSEAKELNNQLAFLKGKLTACYMTLLATREFITSEAIKRLFVGAVEKPRMLLPIIIQHNTDIKALIGQEYSHATWIKYETTRKHIEGFLLYKYKRNDIHLKDLNIEFVSDFEFYLKSEKKIDLNTNAKYIKNFKKIQ